MCLFPRYSAAYQAMAGTITDPRRMNAYQRVRFHPIAWMQFPCGKCLPCRIQKRKWYEDRFRFEAYTHRVKSGFGASFITLTYRNDALPDCGVDPDECRRFCHQLHMRISRDETLPEYSRKHFKYFLVSEYGGKLGRPHYHMIIFGLSPQQLRYHLVMSWPHGFVQVETMKSTTSCFRYVLKYLDKMMTSAVKKVFADSGKNLPFRRMSPGIGISYLEERIKDIRAHHGCYYSKGSWKPLPAYYRNIYGIWDFPTLFWDRPGMTREQLLNATAPMYGKARLDGETVDYEQWLRAERDTYTKYSRYEVVQGTRMKNGTIYWRKDEVHEKAVPFSDAWFLEHRDVHDLYIQDLARVAADDSLASPVLPDVFCKLHS